MNRLTLIALLCSVALVTGCDSGDDGDGSTTEPAQTATEPDTTGSNEVDELERNEGGPQVSTLATGLEAPWEMVFLPDGGALITERPGRVRLMTRDGQLRDEPVATIDRVAAVGEGGLLGMALDPEFEANQVVYLYRTTESGNEVARFRYDLQDRSLKEEAVVAKGMAAAGIHDGGRLHFGPDKQLYFSVGDAADAGRAQDPNSLNGKILRLDEDAYRGDGARPEVFSMGHRNPQGFDWQPETDRFYENEHGNSGNDELNLLRKGANYGWPEVEDGQNREGFTAPLAFYPESIAPSGATFVTLPDSEWSGDYLIGCLVGEQIRRVRFDGTKVTINEPLFEGQFGRIRTVIEGPLGELYALTNNTDGRGSPRTGDDRVLKIVPPAG